MTQFSLPGFDLDRFVRETLAEDLGESLPGGGHDVTSESVIPADARFSGVMDSRDAITVAGLPVALAAPFSARCQSRSVDRGGSTRTPGDLSRVVPIVERLGQRIRGGRPFAPVI